MVATCISPTTRRTCNAQGTAFIDSECIGGRGCVAPTDGGTAAASCQCLRTGQLGCSTIDNDVYEYDSCGTRLSRVADCLLTLQENCIMFPEGPRCSRAVTCTTDSNCASVDHCVDGGCVPDICNQSPPGNRPFCNGEAVTQCRANGSGFQVLQTCTPADGGQACVSIASTPYADCRCVTNAYRGCSNTDIYNFNSCGVRGTLVAFCTSPEECADGPTGPYCQRNFACATDSQCLAGEFCGAGRCAPRVCTPGARQCSGAQLQRCDARGTAWEVVDDCTGGRVCSTAGAGACVCVANARQGCSGAAIYAFDSCGARGALQMTCGANQVCEESGATASCVAPPPPMSCLGDSACGTNRICVDTQCAARVCAPNTTFCAAGTVRACDSRGADSTFLTECEPGTTCTENAGSALCSCAGTGRLGCSGGNVVQLDGCGRVGQLVTTCAASARCVETGNTAVCAALPVDGGVAVDAGVTCTPNASTACSFGDLWSFNSCNQPQGIVDDCQGAITCNGIGGPPACRSSVADAGSPWYTRACPLVQDVQFPTVLPADCRCFVNRAPASGIDRCTGLLYVPLSTRVGTGPDLRSQPQSRFNGGVVVGRELFVGADWSSATNPTQGLVMAVHLDTGDRRIVSGAYQDAATGYFQVGTGPSFHRVIDVKRASTGELYALSVPTTSFTLEIVRFDAVTGNRTLVWRGRDAAFGQCASGDPAKSSVGYHDRSFHVDAAGNFILAFRGAGLLSEGVGLVRVSADGATCGFVTRSGAGPLNAFFGQNIGTGFEVDRGFYSGVTEHQGQLYVLNDALLALFRVDPVTGNRARISSASTSNGVLGAGAVNFGGIGQRWLTWDATRNVMWATGINSYRGMAAVDLATGDRIEGYCRTTNATASWRNICLGGVLEGGFQNLGGFWLDPANGDPILVHEQHSLVRVDLRNGNSMRFSW